MKNSNNIIFFIKTIPYFSTLKDYNIIQDIDISYEKYLVYSLFFKQCISLIFTFTVVFYSTIYFLGLYGALFISLLISIMFYLIDQTLIGGAGFSEISKTRWINLLCNIVLLPVKLLTRILFAGIMALTIATLAEIQIQKKAISNILKEDTKSSNKEFHENISEFKNGLDNELIFVKNEIKFLKKLITNKEKILLSYDVTKRSETELRNELNYLKSETLKLGKVIDKDKKQIAIYKYKLAEKSKLLESYQYEIVEEVKEYRGTEKGSRYNNNAGKIISLTPKIGELKAKISGLEERIKNNNEFSTDNKNNIRNISSVLSQHKNKSIKELNIDLENKAIHLSNLINNKNTSLNLYTNELKKSELYFDTAYGPLELYIGLKKLHKHERYGESAKDFSIALKLIIMVIEIAPVLVTFIFPPFSFYSIIMKNKIRKFIWEDDSFSMKEDIEIIKRENTLQPELNKERKEKTRNEDESLIDDIADAYMKDTLKNTIKSV